MVGKAGNRDFSKATADDLLKMSIAGVFPVANGLLYLPAPNDCVIEKPDDGNERIHHAKPVPISPDEGCDLPNGLVPVTLTDAKEEFKPAPCPDWWRVDRYAKWLVTGNHDFTLDNTFLRSPNVDERTHVALDSDAGAASESLLFSTEALALTRLWRYRAEARDRLPERSVQVGLTARVSAEGWCADAVECLNGFHPLGGERRLVHWKANGETASLWTCPTDVADALNSNPKHVRMILATPAIFHGGWKPAWLDARLQGTPPNSNVALRLVGVCIERWRAVSGWSLQDRGPKPIRRMVPAGGVYFFEVVGGDASSLVDGWLKPVSDDEQEARDGFGLALWGVW
jgi:CRISPR-associated protein Cmr3